MATGSKGRGWRRHLDGWQAGLVLLVLAASAVVLMIPQAAVPEQLPKPATDRAAIRAIIAADDERARRATIEQLDVDVRAVGKAMREYNLVVAQGKRDALTQVRVDLIRAVKRAVGVDEQGLAALRAYQMAKFVAEIRQWQKTGVLGEELVALSGDFVESLSVHRWCTESRDLVMDEATLRVLYKKRWTDLAGLRGPLFDLSLDEDRLRYGFLLEYPFVSTARRAGGVVVEPGSVVDRVRRGEARMKILSRLRVRDPQYPAELARGVIQFRMNRYAVAAAAFRKHLELHPDGPQTLRVRNYLKAALDRVNETGI